MDRVLRIARRIGASPQRVFDAWIDAGIARRWLFATACRPLASVTIDTRVRGSFELIDERDGHCVAYRGEYLEIDPHRRLAFTLSLDPSTLSRVTVDIARAASASRVALTHECVPPQSAAEMRARWIGILYGLDATLAAPPALPQNFDEARCRFRPVRIDHEERRLSFSNHQE